MLNDEDIVRVAHALSDPTRLTILRLVAGGRTDECCSPQDACCPQGVCVCDLEEQVAAGQSRISYHLRELKDAGLVEELRSGRWNYYTVRPERMADYAVTVASMGRNQPNTLAPKRPGD